MNDASELLDLRRLQHLVVLVDVGSFTAAADELGLSQPGLSSSIRRLEAEVGTVLLEREPRVRPTSAGAELVRAARSLLAGAAQARTAVAAVAGLTAGEVRIGTVQTFTSVDLAALLAEFHRAHPGVRIELREDTTASLLQAVAAGEADLAFVALDDRPLPSGLRTGRLFEEELVLITGAGTPLARRTEVRLGDLAEEDFVDFQAGTGLQTVVEQVCAQAGLRRRIAFAATQMSMVLALVRHGLGVAVVPRPVAAHSGLPTVGLGGLVRRLALVLRAGDLTNPAAGALLRLLPEVC